MAVKSNAVEPKAHLIDKPPDRRCGFHSTSAVDESHGGRLKAGNRVALQVGLSAQAAVVNVITMQPVVGAEVVADVESQVLTSAGGGA